MYWEDEYILRCWLYEMKKSICYIVKSAALAYIAINVTDLQSRPCWTKKEVATTKRHADEISPQYTSKTGSDNTATYIITLFI